MAPDWFFPGFQFNMRCDSHRNCKGFSGSSNGIYDNGVNIRILFAIPYLLMFLFTRERVNIDAQTENKWSLKEFFEPFQIRTFKYLVFIYLFSFLAMDIVSPFLLTI